MRYAAGNDSGFSMLHVAAQFIISETEKYCKSGNFRVTKFSC